MGRDNNTEDSHNNPRQHLLSAFMLMQRKLLASAQKLLTSYDDAEDVLQEAFTKLWSSSARINTEQEASALLYVTTKNISLNTLRDRKRTSTSLDSAHIADQKQPSYEEAFTQKETFAKVEEIINRQLTPLQQRIIELREYEQRSFEEIAQLLDMQPTAIRMQLSRARKTIRQCYQNNRYD